MPVIPSRYPFSSTDSLRAADAHIRHWDAPPLVQVMARRPLRAKPLHGPTVFDSQLELLGTNCSKICIIIQWFSIKKMYLKMSSKYVFIVAMYSLLVWRIGIWLRIYPWEGWLIISSVASCNGMSSLQLESITWQNVVLSSIGLEFSLMKFKPNFKYSFQTECVWICNSIGARLWPWQCV